MRAPRGLAASLAVAGLIPHAACQPASSAQEKPPDRQIAEAVSAAPEPLRTGATVLGWRGGELVPLREGTGELVCLADDPSGAGFHVACYHRDLEPFMALGRRLRQEGSDEEGVRRARLAAIESGDLRLPERPAALYSLTAEEDAGGAAAGWAPQGRRLFVLYTPYATAEETGLPERPSAGDPWLMSPGTPFAHVMMSR